MRKAFLLLGTAATGGRSRHVVGPERRAEA